MRLYTGVVMDGHICDLLPENPEPVAQGYFEKNAHSIYFILRFNTLLDQEPRQFMQEKSHIRFDVLNMLVWGQRSIFHTQTITPLVSFHLKQ